MVLNKACNIPLAINNLNDKIYRVPFILKPHWSCNMRTNNIYIKQPLYKDKMLCKNRESFKLYFTLLRKIVERPKLAFYSNMF